MTWFICRKPPSSWSTWTCKEFNEATEADKWFHDHVDTEKELTLMLQIKFGKLLPNNIKKWESSRQINKFSHVTLTK